MFIDIFFSVFKLFKHFLKIYDYFKLKLILKKLEDYKFDKDNDSHVNNCICLEEVDEGKRLPCGHVFHFQCIK